MRQSEGICRKNCCHCACTWTSSLLREGVLFQERIPYDDVVRDMMNIRSIRHMMLPHTSFGRLLSRY